MNKGTVAILIPENTADRELRPDENDTFEEAEIIAASLANLGFIPTFVHCSTNLEHLASRLRELQPQFCFNLVEQLSGVGSLVHIVPSLLECLGIPFPGANAAGILLTTDKVLAKRFLMRAGLTTPQFLADGTYSSEKFVPGKYIVKPVAEDASTGIEDSNVVVANTLDELNEALDKIEIKSGFHCFAEEFIDGREFNVSVLQNGKEYEILPPAELVFKNFARGKPKIVGYAAKWIVDSFEYHNIIRKQEFNERDEIILKKIETLAVECGKFFNLKGYYRVDFRSRGNKVYIIDINANPALGKEAGFVAAAEKAGLTFDKIIARIIGSTTFSSPIKLPSILATEGDLYDSMVMN